MHTNEAAIPNKLVRKIALRNLPALVTQKWKGESIIGKSDYRRQEFSLASRVVVYPKLQAKLEMDPKSPEGAVST